LYVSRQNPVATLSITVHLGTFPVKKSVNMDELVSALATVGDGTLKMMFENDEKVSFSFGPDQGAEISFGVMRVIDVYDERYLVGHSICDGVFSSLIPKPSNCAYSVVACIPSASSPPKPRLRYCGIRAARMLPFSVSV